MDIVIECKDVTYSYPLAKKPAVQNLNLRIERGKFYGVIGENGAGKTTLGAILRGFAPSFYKGELKGEVLVEGKNISEYGGELSTKIGYVFQNPFTQISGVKDTVFEEVAYGLENFGVPVEEIERRVVDVMKMTDIISLAEKNPYDLSGGQMQRVALASVIVLQPDILIIDEPTSQLDPEGTESVFKIIRKLKEEHKTVILIEHKIDLIAEYADDVLVFKDSSMIAEGPKEKILSDMSLSEQGAALPQVAILGSRLKKMGLPISTIPVTEKQAVEVISEALKGMKQA
jgi:energy-coupling factor transport system ATP-binding protein